MWNNLFVQMYFCTFVQRYLCILVQIHISTNVLLYKSTFTYRKKPEFHVEALALKIKHYDEIKKHLDFVVAKVKNKNECSKFLFQYSNIPYSIAPEYVRLRLLTYSPSLFSILLMCNVTSYIG